jgi:hypothetical protein
MQEIEELKINEKGNPNRYYPARVMIARDIDKIADKINEIIKRISEDLPCKR